MLGLKDVAKAIDLEPSSSLIVFIVHSNEIEALNKHIVGFCRQKEVRHVLLPRFMHAQITELFKVKRLSTFALKHEGYDLLEPFISGFDNRVKESSTFE